MRNRKRRKRPRKASRRYVLVKALDRLWSLVVRKRAGWKCEWCGATERLQGAHLFPKGAYPALRHDPSNGACLCWSCHLGPRGAHKDVMIWAEHFERILGKRGQTVEALRQRALTARRPDREAIRLALEKELG